MAAPLPTAALALKPRLRGVVHEYAFYVSLLSGLVLLFLAPTPRAFTAALVYGASLSALLGASALYHRVHWAVGPRRWMARLDHAMISVLIAGTYTPFGVLAVSGTVAEVLVGVVWAGALVGLTLHLVWVDLPKWVSALLYVVLGWVGVVAFPQLTADLGWRVPTLLLAGGLLYSIGAAVYAVRRPNPWPAVFGYHEVFHVLVVAAAAMHYAAVVMVLRASS